MVGPRPAEGATVTATRANRRKIWIPAAVLALAAAGQCGVAYAMFTDSVTAGPGSFQTATLAAPAGLSTGNGGCTTTATQQSNVTSSWTGSATRDAGGNYLVGGYTVLRSTTLGGTYTSIGTLTGSPPAVTYTDTGPSGATTPTAYVAGGDGSAATLASINTSTDAITKVTTGTLGKEPNALAVTPDRSKLIAAEGASHEVQIIATATNTISNTVTIPGATSDPVAVTVSPDGTTAWIVDKANSLLYPLTLATAALGTGIAVGTQADPTALLITPDGTKVYVAAYGSHEVSEVNTSTKVVTNITIGGATGHPIAMAVTPNSANVYVADQANNQIDDVATASETVTKTLAVASMVDGNVANAGDPNILAITPDGTKLYVASFTGGSIEDFVVAGGTLTLTTTITLASYTRHRTVAPEPDALALTPNGCQLYVADYNNRQVDAITVSNDTPTAEPAVGTPADPTGISATPNSAAVWVANEGTHTVSVVATSTNTATTVTLPAASTAYAIAITPNPYYYKVTSTHGIWASAVSAPVMYPLGWDPGNWQ
jgi:YVTN family beta-propeller protein